MIASGGDGEGRHVPRLSQASTERAASGGGRPGPGDGPGGSAAAPVEAALAPLRRLETLPVREHVAVYEQVLADLEATLATVAADPAAAGGTGGGTGDRTPHGPAARPDGRAGAPDGAARP